MFVAASARSRVSGFRKLLSVAVQTQEPTASIAATQTLIGELTCSAGFKLKLRQLSVCLCCGQTGPARTLTLRKHAAFAKAASVQALHLLFACDFAAGYFTDSKRASHAIFSFCR